MSQNYYAVVGAPIAHSLSPIIHQTFAKQFQQALIYKKLFISPTNFTKILPQLFSAGLQGANITAPFKLLAYEFAEECTSRAQLAQSVNTLYFNEQGKLCGDTTDGAGLIFDIVHHHKQQINDKNIMILGSGGTTRSLLPALLTEKPRAIFLAHHDEKNARGLVERLSTSSITVLPLKAFADYSCDILINTIPTIEWVNTIDFSSSLNLENTWCYDICYGNLAADFKAFAEQYGARKVINGIGMLIAQAAESFYIWHGVRPAINFTFPLVGEIDRALARAGKGGDLSTKR